MNQEFIAYLADAVGDETPSLLDALSGEPSVSVRWNPFKTEAAPTTVAGVDASEPVPWHRYGRYAARRPSFTADPEFHSGRYYVQEASSMFVGHIFESVSGEGSRVLDMCAAPGGKTTLYSTLAGLEGVVVANEVIRSRAGVLSDNVRKWGLGNVIVTNNDPSHFSLLREWFDIVAVDAPCSGEGMFRKTPLAQQEWSADNVKMSAARQRRILSDAWEALAPGGTLIYSTCTFNRLENEDNVVWLAENFDCEDPAVEVPAQWNIVQTEAGGIRCFRFMPGRLRGEGFFCAAVRKAGQRGRPVNPRPRKAIFTDIPKNTVREVSRWAAHPQFMRFAQVGDQLYGYYDACWPDVKTVCENFTALHSGVCMGQIFGGQLKPDHSLAMFHDLAPEATPRIDVDAENAIKYLRRQEFEGKRELEEGLNLVCYDGAPLGWAKRIGARCNNLYPKSLMIVNANISQ